MVSFVGIGGRQSIKVRYEKIKGMKSKNAMKIKKRKKKKRREETEKFFFSLLLDFANLSYLLGHSA